MRNLKSRGKSLYILVALKDLIYSVLIF